MTVAPISISKVEADMNAAASGSRERAVLELYVQYLRWRKWEFTVHSAPGAECLVKRRHSYIEGQCCEPKRQQVRDYAEWERVAEGLLPSEDLAPVNSQSWWNRLGIGYDMRADVVD
jgi:hypothetical protein